jgi:hypothetical protein
MGMGATHTLERVAASLGALTEAPVKFEPALDVANGGVLLSLPALSVNGLLKHCAAFSRLPAGFYGLFNILLLLAFLALARIKNIEGLHQCAPGEWGKLLGLDRAPEPRTLRRKVELLSQPDFDKTALYI